MPFSSLQEAATSPVPDGEGCVAWSRWRWTWSSSGGCVVGRITRRGKSARKPLAGNPHERFEVAGAGNGPVVLGTAPALDPTCVQRRLVCSVGVSPTGVTARRPVAWIAARKETEWSEAYRQSHHKGW